MKKIFITIPVIILILVLVSPCLALTKKPTPTPSPAKESLPSPEVTPEATATPKTNVETIREEVKKMVREKIEEVKKGRKLAYFGEISQINDSIITITNPTGENKVVVSGETTIIGKKKNNLQPKDLKIGDYVIAMGYVQEDGSLAAKRLLVIEKPKPPVRQVVFGKVTDISVEEKILTVRNEKKGATYTVVINDKTIITAKTDSKVERVKFSSIQKGDRIVAIGLSSENEKRVITAKLIHVIPGKALGQVKPTLSPTPKPKVTKTEE